MQDTYNEFFGKVSYTVLWNRSVLPHHPQHLDVDDEEPEELIEQVRPELFRHSRRYRRIVVLTVRCPVFHGVLRCYSGTMRQKGFAFAL